MEENMAHIELVGSCLAGMNWPIRGTGILAQFGSDRAPFYVRVFMLSKTICSEQHPTLALFNDSFEIDRTISFIPQVNPSPPNPAPQNLVKILLKLSVCSCWDGVNRNHILNLALCVLTAHYQCIVTNQLLVGRYGIVKLWFSTSCLTVNAGSLHLIT